MNQKPEVVDDLKQQVEESMGFDPMGNLMGISNTKFSKYSKLTKTKSKMTSSFNVTIDEEDDSESSCEDDENH